MDIDMRSVLAIAAVTELLFAAMAASNWSQQAARRPLNYWALGSFCAGLSCFVTTFRGQIPDFISIEGGNVLIYSALGLRLAGLRSFAGHPVKLWRLLLPPLLLGLLFHFREPLGLDVAKRVLISGALGIAYGLLMLVDLIRAQRRETLVMRRIVIVVICLQTLNDIVRVLLGGFGAFQSNQFLSPQTGYPILLLNVLCIYGVLNLACFMMMFERHEAQLLRAATLDALTQLLNRAGFKQLAERQRQRSLHDGEPVSVLVMDLDHFKQINDRYGHEAGDQVLQAFAHCARAALRPTDLLARPGGEEFWALVPNADLHEAQRLAQRVCDQFRGVCVHHAGQEIAATVSLGVAEIALPNESLTAALARADQALYEAKRGGRNRVVGSPQFTASPAAPTPAV